MYVQLFDGKSTMVMTEESCRVVEIGDLFALKEHAKKIGASFYRSRDSEGSNLVQKLLCLIKWRCIILPGYLLDYMKDILIAFPDLLGEADNNGDTPAHVLAKLSPDNILIYLATGLCHNPTDTENLYPGPKPDDPIFFDYSYQQYTYVWEILGRTPFFTDLIDLCLQYSDKRWLLMQNVNGNTPLHEATLANNYLVFKQFAEFNTEATTVVNNCNETILHLLATHPMLSLSDDVLDDIIKNNTKDKQPLLDKDGLTPVMRAIRAGNVEFAERLISLCPSLAELRDANGQTFWHLLVKEPPIVSFNLKNSSFTKEVVFSQLDIKDNDGKTALHLAIECRRFDLAEAFLGLHGAPTSKGIPIFLKQLLHIQNDEGITPADLIGELAYVPLQVTNYDLYTFCQSFCL
ncbi:Ankyrin repeat-containing protein ITN1 [Bienertia sinuspersici]